jgi:maleate isomerase
MTMMDQLTWRAKIGLITNSGQLVTEPRYNQLAPTGVSFHATRLLNPSSGLDGLREMEKNVWRGVGELATAKVHSIAYCCATSGALRGLAEDKAFCEEVHERYGIPTTSTMLAGIEALGRFGAKRVAVATPYQDDHNEPERAYFADAGIETVVIRGMGLVGGGQYSLVPPQEIYDFCIETWDESADALFVSCMNFDSLAVIEALEQRISKPVVTSHSATLWRALALAGVDDPVEGCGTLLSERRLATAS